MNDHRFLKFNGQRQIFAKELFLLHGGIGRIIVVAARFADTLNQRLGHTIAEFCEIVGFSSEVAVIAGATENLPQLLRRQLQRERVGIRRSANRQHFQHVRLFGTRQNLIKSAVFYKPIKMYVGINKHNAEQ